MDTTFHLDYEVRSRLDLGQSGLDRYATDPSTQILMAAYAEGDHAPKIWEPHLSPTIPAELKDALEDPWVQVHAWNASFERAISKYVLGVDTPVQEFRDPMVHSRYLSLPGNLGDAGKVLGLKEDSAKMEVGERLIDLFCFPESEGGEETLFGTSQPCFRDWSTDWELFKKYCKQDVIAERAIEKKLSAYPMPEAEWEAWFVDQWINETGWPTDSLLNTGAKFLVDKALSPLIEEMKEITGLANPGSRNQLLGWLGSSGYTFGALKKDFVKRALEGECPLTDAAKRVLEIRSQTSKSSVSKYTAISDKTSADGRLRYEYQFMGASRTHRWSSLGVNMGNLPRPTKQVEKNLNRAVELVQKMDYDGIVSEFGKPLDVVSSVLRSSFRAPKGYKFVVADLASIENRALGYLSRCSAILDVFTTTFTYEGEDHPEKDIFRGMSVPLDPYLEFATRMYQQPYAELWYEWKIKGDTTKRTMAKPGSLGAGYSMGVGEQKVSADGDIFFTGLLGYARAMGVVMSPEEAEHAIKVFRDSYKEVVYFWSDMSRAALRAVRNPGELVGVGVPYSEKDADYFRSKGRKTNNIPLLNFQCVSPTQAIGAVNPLYPPEHHKGSASL